MSDQPNTFSDAHRRALIGVVAIVFAAAAIWLNLIDPQLGQQYPQFAYGTVRMVPVLAVLWLALPEIRRGPGALLFIAAAICAVALIFKSGRSGLKFLIPAIGVLMTLGYLRRFTALLGGKPRR